MYKVFSYEDFVDVDGDKCNVYVLNPNGDLDCDDVVSSISSIAAASRTIAFVSDPNLWIESKINIRGSASNDGIYTIKSVSGGGSYVVEESVVNEGAGGIAERIHFSTIPGHIYDSISYGNYMVVLTYGNDIGLGDYIFLNIIDVDGNIYSSAMVGLSFFSLTMTVLAGGYICVLKDSSMYVFNLFCDLIDTYFVDVGYYIVGSFMNLILLSNNTNLRMMSKKGDTAKEVVYPSILKLIESSSVDRKWFINYITSEVGVIDSELNIEQTIGVPGVSFAAESVDGKLYVGLSAPPVPTINVYDRSLSLVKVINMTPLATVLYNMGIDDLNGIWVDTDSGVYRWKAREGLLEQSDGSVAAPPAQVLNVPGSLIGHIGTLPYNLIYNNSERISVASDGVRILSDGMSAKKVFTPDSEIGTVSVSRKYYFATSNKTGSFNTILVFTKRLRLMESVVVEQAHDIVSMYPVRNNNMVIQYVSTGGDLKLALFKLFNGSATLINEITLDNAVSRKITVTFSGVIYLIEEDGPTYKLRRIFMSNLQEDSSGVQLSAAHDLLYGSKDYLPSSLIRSRSDEIYMVGVYIYNLSGANCDLGLFVKRFDGIVELSEKTMQIGSLTSSSSANTINAVNDFSVAVDGYDNIYFSNLLWNGNPKLLDPLATFTPVNCNAFPPDYLSSGTIDNVRLLVDFDNRIVLESTEGNISRIMKLFSGNEVLSVSPLATGLVVGSIDYDANYRGVWDNIDAKEYRGGY